MRYQGVFLVTTFLVYALQANGTVRGHGMPLTIDGASGRLIVANGLRLGPGYVQQAFDPSEEAGLDFPSTTVRTDLPGFDVSNVASETLHLEVLSRRDLTLDDAPSRWLWYWDPSSDNVAVADNDPDFLIRRKDLGGSVTFDQLEGTSASVLPLTESLIPDSHQHYVRYELENVPDAAFGVYGFFGRILATGYEPSDPVLFAFSYGTTVDQYVEAANAINLAASFQADFDASGVVDGADFLLWQRTFGAAGSYSAADANLDGLVNAGDLMLWRSQIGNSTVANQVAASVPEPNGIVLTLSAVALVSLPIVPRSRRRLGFSGPVVELSKFYHHPQA